MSEAGSVEFILEANLEKLRQDLENAKKNISNFAGDAEKRLKFTPQIDFNAKRIRTQAIGKSISDGIAKGIDNKKIESTGKQVAESLVSSVKRVLKINSPSKVFWGIGEDIVDGLSGGVKGKIKTFTDNVKGEVGNLVSDLQKQSPMAKLSFTGLAVGAGAIALFKDEIIGLGKSAVNTATEFESLTNTINIVSGSATKGASKFGELKSLASELGVDLKTLSSGYAKLSASTNNTSLEGADTDGMIKAISQAGVAYGLSNEQLSGSILAISQMAGKGVVSMEELRGQLAERIPGAVGIAARAMKLTERELFDLVATGTLSTSDFFPKFYKQLGIEIPTSSDTARQSFARLGNEITEISIKAGNALLPIVSGLAKVTTEVLKFVSANFDTILKGIAGAFGAIAIASGPVIMSLASGLTAIATKLGLANTGAILASIGFKGLLAILGPLVAKAGLLYAVLETGGAVFNLLKDQLGGSKQAYSDWADQVDASVEKVNKALENVSKKEIDIKPPRLDKNKVVSNNNWFADLFSMSPENIEKSVANANKIREKFGKAPMSESEINSFRERARSPLGFTGLTRSKGQNEADQAKINMSEAGLKSNKFSDLLGTATQQYKSGSGPLAEVAKIEKAMKGLHSQKSIIPAGDVATAKQLDAELAKLTAEKNKLMAPLEGAESGMRGWLKLNQEKYAEYLQALQDQTSDDQKKREQANKFLTSAGNDDASMEQVRINAELASKALAQYEQAQKSSGAVSETQRLALALAELGSAFENIKARTDQMNISKLTEIGKIELSGFDSDIFNSFNSGVAKAEQGVASLKQEIQDRENITKKLTEDLSISPARQSAIKLISEEELAKGKKLVSSEIEALAKVWGQQDTNLKSALESEAKLRGETQNTAQMKLELLGQELALKQAIEQKTLAGLAEERSALQALNKIKNNDGNVAIATTYKEGMQTNINAESDFNVESAQQALISLQANTNEVAKAIDRLNQKRLDGSLSAEKYNEQIRQLSLEQSDLSVQIANAEISQIKAVQQARADDLARRKQELETKINIQNTSDQSDIISQKLAGSIDENKVATELAKLSKENNKALLTALDENKANIESAFNDGAMNLRDYTQQIQQIELERVRLIKSTLEDELNIRKAVDNEILANMDKRVKEQSHLFNIEMLQAKEKSKLSELKSTTPKSDLAEQLEQNKTALLEAGQAIDQMKLKLSEMQSLSPSPENTQKILDLERELNEAVLGKRITLLDQQLALKNKIKSATELEAIALDNQAKIMDDLSKLESSRSAEVKARANLELKGLEAKKELANIDLGDAGNYEIGVKLLDQQFAIQQAINKSKSDQVKADLDSNQKALEMDYQREQITLRKAEIENRLAVLRAKDDVVTATQSGITGAIALAQQQLKISNDSLSVILQQKDISDQNHTIKKNTLNLENQALLAEGKVTQYKEQQAQLQNKLNLAQASATKEIDKQKTKLDAIANLNKAISNARVNALEKQIAFQDQALQIQNDLKDENINPVLKDELKGQLNQLTGGNTDEKSLFRQRLEMEQKLADEKMKALAKEHQMQKAMMGIELAKNKIAAAMAVAQAKILAIELAKNGMAEEGKKLVEGALEAQQEMAGLGDMARESLSYNQASEVYNQEVENYNRQNEQRRKMAEAGYAPNMPRPEMPKFDNPTKSNGYSPNQSGGFGVKDKTIDELMKSGFKGYIPLSMRTAQPGEKFLGNTEPQYKPAEINPNDFAQDATQRAANAVEKFVQTIQKQLEDNMKNIPAPSGPGGSSQNQNSPSQNNQPIPDKAGSTSNTNQSNSEVSNTTTVNNNYGGLTFISSDPTGDARKVIGDLTKAKNMGR